MAQTTFVNGRGVAHKKSGGVSVVFPDVCKTPTPGGPTPIPYPNIGESSDTADGPKTVTMDGQMPMVKGAKYSKTTGDEAGTAGGGVVSSKIKAEADQPLVVASIPDDCLAEIEVENNPPAGFSRGTERMLSLGKRALEDLLNSHSCLSQ